MGMKLSFLTPLLAAMLLPSAALAQSAKTESGLIAGSQEEGLSVFKGIPYAAPPIGDLRWQAPAPPVRWSGTRETRSFGPACPQAIRPGAQPLRTSEDCLTLNIWAPAGKTKNLPVFVWIFGGGFVGGDSSSPISDGAAIARQGIVVVTINHRFGALGYMAHPELSAASPRYISANYGLLDQIAALQWVQRNVAAFGGDPAKVTLGGQSSGGISVGALMASPQAKGLFRAAIIHSAPITGLTPQPPELSDAEQFGAAFTSVRGANTLSELKGLSADQLVAFSPSEAALASPFRPTIDGVLLPAHPLRLFATGSEASVPLMIGSTAHESARITPLTPRLEQFQAWVRRSYPAQARMILAHYAPAGVGPDELRERWLAVKSDDIFSGTRRQALFHARAGNPTWVFRFDREPPGASRAQMRAYHGADLPYLFGTLGTQDNPWEESDRQLSRQMIAYWSNFIKSGNPNGTGLTQWPQFKPDAEVQLRLDSVVTTSGIPDLEKLSLFESPVLN